MDIKRVKRLALSILFMPACVGCLTSCKDKYDIWIWGPENHRNVYMTAIKNYKKEHPDFKYSVGFADKGDAGADGNVQKDVESAGSIIALPNDELVTFRRIGALSPLLEADEDWAFEHHVEAAVEATKIGEKYMAYPISADNGFVFVYNKDAFENTSMWDAENDNLKVDENYTFRNLFKALEDTGDQADFKWASGGKVIWPIGSAWYESGVFFATGCDYSVEYDEKGEQKSVWCNFGDPDKGLEALRCMVNTATGTDGKWSKHFVFTDDADPAYNDYVTAHVNNKEEPLAGIVTWNNTDLRKAWGDDYRAQILPALSSDVENTCLKHEAGESPKEYTWRSFSGFKLLCVNPFSRFARQGDNVEILHELAKYLAGKDVSLLRYEATQLGPSNKEAAADPEVAQDKFLDALNEQFSLTEIDPETGEEKVIGCRTQDNTPKNFWTPIARVGKAVWETFDQGKGPLTSISAAQAFLKQVEDDIKSSGS